MTRETRIEMILDGFLISNSPMEENFRIRQWVSVGGDSNHNPIFLELDSQF